MPSSAWWSMTRKFERGSIWLADLNPPRGTEPGKTRPVLIFQHQALLDAEHPSTVVIPLTTNLITGAQPLRIRVTAREMLKKDSDLLIDQLRAIDNRRLSAGPLARIAEDEMKAVDEAVTFTLGLNSGTD